MNIDSIHLAYRSTIEGNQKILSELEAKLREETARRAVILDERAKAADAVARGEQKARVYQAQLNKEDVAAGRLIVSITNQIAAARKRVELAEAQAAAAALKQAQAAIAGDNWFECLCPDGRKVRHRGASLESLQRVLQPGYRALGQVFGANEDGTGGFIPQPGFLTAMLEAQGDELMEWLATRGVIGSDKTVVILPNNNREMQ